ncbi:hypothetical protein BC829DRAFT_166009 [Chytridium lagenaria]|nr:hypothetical protein BC829DRAFT_166009 [Chytridium lagenaria]
MVLSGSSLEEPLQRHPKKLRITIKDESDEEEEDTNHSEDASESPVGQRRNRSTRLRNKSVDDSEGKEDHSEEEDGNANPDVEENNEDNQHKVEDENSVLELDVDAEEEEDDDVSKPRSKRQRLENGGARSTAGSRQRYGAPPGLNHANTGESVEAGEEGGRSYALRERRSAPGSYYIPDAPSLSRNRSSRSSHSHSGSKKPQPLPTPSPGGRISGARQARLMASTFNNRSSRKPAKPRPPGYDDDDEDDEEYEYAMSGISADDSRRPQTRTRNKQFSYKEASDLDEPSSDDLPHDRSNNRRDRSRRASAMKKEENSYQDQSLRRSSRRLSISSEGEERRVRIRQSSSTSNTELRCSPGL